MRGERRLAISNSRVKIDCYLSVSNAPAIFPSDLIYIALAVYAYGHFVGAVFINPCADYIIERGQVN